MFNLFKEKCPVCKMNLEKGKEYPQAGDKKFCSENCKVESEKPKQSGGSCCH